MIEGEIEMAEAGEQSRRLEGEPGRVIEMGRQCVEAGPGPLLAKAETL